MKNLYNPTDSLVYIVFNGSRYEIPPKGELEVSDDVAEHWTTNIHNFLQTRPLPLKQESKKTLKTASVEPEKQST